MKIISFPLSFNEIKDLKEKSGAYLKLTVDIEKKVIITDIKLHADGERVLLEKGSRSENIWGGGISLDSKTIDVMAVLNIRPNMGNNSLELLDPVKRDKFIQIVKEFFGELWEN